MDHQPATEDLECLLETRRPVETSAGAGGSGNSLPVTQTHLRQNLGQCPSGERTSARFTCRVLDP